MVAKLQFFKKTEVIYMLFAQWKLFSFFSLPVPISVRIHSPYFFLMKVSEREHTRFHHGNIMHPLVEYSLGSDVRFVYYDCRINCYFGRRKSW